MSKRKKRAAKSIDSLGKQIEIHEKKLEEAIKSGNVGLSDYYRKEIETLKSALYRKRKIVEK
jgi:hypothetical protein